MGHPLSMTNAVRVGMPRSILNGWTGARLPTASARCNRRPLRGVELMERFNSVAFLPRERLRRLEHFPRVETVADKSNCVQLIVGASLS